jgi:hypothetical protein
MNSELLPALYAPLILSRDKKTGCVRYALPATHACHFGYCAPQNSQTNQNHSQNNNQYSVDMAKPTKVQTTSLPLLAPSIRVRDRRSRFKSWCADNAPRLCALTSAIRARLQVYQERMHRECSIHVDISWDMLFPEVCNMAFRCSSSCSPSGSNSNNI